MRNECRGFGGFSCCIARTPAVSIHLQNTVALLQPHDYVELYRASVAPGSMNATALVLKSISIFIGSRSALDDLFQLTPSARRCKRSPAIRQSASHRRATHSPGSSPRRLRANVFHRRGGCDCGARRDGRDRASRRREIGPQSRRVLRQLPRHRRGSASAMPSRSPASRARKSCARCRSSSRVRGRQPS